MSAKLEEGTVFAGRYRVVRCLAAGGMGAVYEVVHLETNRKRALKVMHPHLFQSEEMRERFKLEARIAAEVDSEAQEGNAGDRSAQAVDFGKRTFRRAWRPWWERTGPGESPVFPDKASRCDYERWRLATIRAPSLSKRNRRIRSPRPVIASITRRLSAGRV